MREDEKARIVYLSKSAIAALLGYTEELIRHSGLEEPDACNMLARLSTTFGILALILVSTGICGVISCSVSRRTREIGIRLALGADPGRIRRMVLVEVGFLAALGLLVGLPVAIGAGAFMEKLLFAVKAGDAVSLAATALVVAVVSLISAWIPARRVSRVDPMKALRWE